MGRERAKIYLKKNYHDEAVGNLLIINWNHVASDKKSVCVCTFIVYIRFCWRIMFTSSLFINRCAHVSLPSFCKSDRNTNSNALSAHILMQANNEYKYEPMFANIEFYMCVHDIPFTLKLWNSVFSYNSSIWRMHTAGLCSSRFSYKNFYNRIYNRYDITVVGIASIIVTNCESEGKGKG